MNEPMTTFRKAGPEDLPGLLPLYAQLGQDDGQILTHEAALAVLERIASYPDYQIRVALREGRVVGTYALLVMDNMAHLGAPSAVVEDVVVDQDLRGCGIGAAMMREAMVIASERGCYKIVLNSNRNRLDAHRFYEGLGFQPHGVSFFVPREVDRA